LQPDHHALVGWDIDASDTGHVSSLLYATGAGFPATARPLLPIRLSPEKATNVKSQRMPAAAAWHRCSISDRIFETY
jgi:hypothetical protein